jgi:hypothetical protein
LEGADDGIRTHTPLSRERILSPLRLPFRHIGAMRALYAGRCADQDFLRRSNYIRKAAVPRNY